MGVIDIAAAGNALLDNIVQQMTDGDVTLPTNQGLVPGALLAYDGEQLTINWLDITMGSPGVAESTSQSTYRLLFYYEFSISLLREIHVPTGEGSDGGIPTMTEMTDDFTMLVNDAEQLLAAAVAIHTQYLVVGPNIPFAYGPLSSLGPEGGLAGCRLPVNFQAGVSATY